MDLTSLTIEELEQLKKDIEHEFERRRREARAQFKARVAQLAKEMGISLDEALGLLKGEKRERDSSKKPPKYRHPTNPDITWNGHGRAPKWFKEWTDSGRSPEELEIK